MGRCIGVYLQDGDCDSCYRHTRELHRVWFSGSEHAVEAVFMVCPDCCGGH